MIAYIKSFSILLFIDPGKIKMGKGAAAYPKSEYNGERSKTNGLEEDEIDEKEHEIDFERVIKHKEVRVELM